MNWCRFNPLTSEISNSLLSLSGGVAKFPNFIIFPIIAFPYIRLFLRMLPSSSSKPLLLPKRRILEAKTNIIDINDVLSDDILTQILCRLPCNLAVRCQTVCKRWRSIISKPCFARIYTGHQLRLRGDEVLSFHTCSFQIVMLSKLISLDRFSLDFLPCYQGVRGIDGIIMSSCQGLILCSTKGYDGVMYYVCNPLTRQWVTIPPAPLPASPRDNDIPTAFTCDPYYRLDDQGAVIINPHCRFRILRAFGNSLPDDPIIDFDIYSSETGEWNNLRVQVQRQGKFELFPNFDWRRVASHNGRVYLQVGRALVVYNPFTTEACGEIDFPEVTGQPERPFEGFTSCRGSLWMCLLNNSISRLFMWELKEATVRGERVEYQWILKREATLPPFFRCSSSFAKIYTLQARVLAIHPDNPDLVYLNIIQRRDKDGVVVMWNLMTGKMEATGRSEAGYYCTWTKAFYIDVNAWPRPVPHIQGHL